MGRHDLSYRLFFSHLRMIRDLLCEIVGEGWVERLDVDSGERVSTSFVSPQDKNRESDVIWKFRRKDGGDPVYVYVLLEFQSRPDAAMAVRLMSYVGLFYEHLLAGRLGPPGSKLPLVIPIVVYNGAEPWNVATDLGSLIGDLDLSAEIYRPQLRYRLIDEARYPREQLEALRSPVADLFAIEASRNWQDVWLGVRRLRDSLPPEEADLRRAFKTWLQSVILPRFGHGGEETASLSLEELESMLADSIDRWNRQIREEGLEEGLERGLEQGRQDVVLRLLRLKFGPLSHEVEEQVRAADAGQLLSWSERILTAQQLADVFAG